MPLVKKRPRYIGRKIKKKIIGIGIKRLVKRVDKTVDYAGVKSIKYYI